MILRRFFLYAGILSGVFLAYQGANAAFGLPDLGKVFKEASELAQVCEPNSRFVNRCDNHLWGHATCNAQGTDWEGEQNCRYMTEAEAQTALTPPPVCSAGQKVVMRCDNRFWGFRECNAQGTY